jgi:methionine aminopeptidase
VTSAVKQVAKDYGVNLLQGVLSHQLKRYVIDGNKVVIQREEHDQKVADATFEANEVYAVDIALCTGDDAEAKARQREGRTTVFKRAVDVSYKLRRKTSRGLLSEVNKNHPTLPFTLRSLSNATQAKAGVIECTRHELLHEYPVLRVKDGTLVVHLKFVLLLLPSGSNRVTGQLSNLPKFTSDKTVSDDIAKILATSTKKKRRKKKKKKKKNQPAAAPAETAAPEEAAAPSLPAPSE